MGLPPNNPFLVGNSTIIHPQSSYLGTPISGNLQIITQGLRKPVSPFVAKDLMAGHTKHAELPWCPESRAHRAPACARKSRRCPVKPRCI